MAVAGGSSLKAVVAVNMPDSVQALNIFYAAAVFQDEQTEQDVIDEIEVWVEDMYGEIAHDISEECSLGLITVYKHNAITNQWDNIGSAQPTVAFDELSEMLPHGVAALVRQYTTDPRTIGRKYIPGFGESQNEDGALSAAAIQTLGLFAAQWDNTREISGGNTLVPGVWKDQLKTIRQMSGSSVVLADFAYQRRRRPGVGS